MCNERPLDLLTAHLRDRDLEDGVAAFRRRARATNEPVPPVSV